MTPLAIQGAWHSQCRLARTTQRHCGFTLLEVLVAIVILSVGLLGLSAMTIATIRGLAFSKDVTTATNLAQGKMEELKNKDYADPDMALGSYQENYGDIPGFQRFERLVEIGPGPNDVQDNTKTTIVGVSWRRAKGGQPHNVILQTIISR